MTLRDGSHIARIVVAVAAAGLAVACNASPADEAEARHAPAGNFAVERDADVAITQDGPHDGGGPTTGHSFFESEDGLEFVFKKRVLHPGSAIGLHTQSANEIYYVLSGTGRYTMDDELIEVGPGMALLTKPGGSHALQQTGDQDLVLIIVYPRH
jgi:mannose-6-phosphate isomerase-like protein (cupin superfamily)